MRQALAEAAQAHAEGEVPIGCVIEKDGVLLAAAHNRMEQTGLATAHAEMLAIAEASQKLGNWRLEGCTVYVTLEPCLMCLGAIVNARVAKVVYGASDPRRGAVSQGVPALAGLPQEIEGGVLEAECVAALQSFFQEKRAEKGDTGRKKIKNL
jgi:tRNA(adenine34) deaminase